jgi:hypothetical protein
VDAALTPPLTLACALEVEEKAARKAGARAVRVGLRATRHDLPDGRIVGFGLAGALIDGLEPGVLVTAARIVDESGEVLWEGEPLSVPGARPAVICAAQQVVDDPVDRRALAARSGAAAVDMESGELARSGRLAGVVRAVSDTPAKPVGRLAAAATDEGRTDWAIVVRAFVTEPLVAARAALGARRALAALEQAAASFAGEAR